MQQRPNFLLFIPDAMPGQVVRPGHDCKTPNVDRVAGRGVRFDRAHTVLSTCSPARASLMTGVLPHNHGVLQVEHCVDDDQSVLRREHPHWAQRLSEAGYRTGYFGKWHIERTNRVEDFGWQVNGCNAAAALRSHGAGRDGADALVKDTTLLRYESGPEGYNDILHYAVTNLPSERRPFANTVRDAQQFLSEVTRDDQPWACCVSFSEPNTPVAAQREVFEQYDVDAIALPPNLHDDMRGKPNIYRREQGIYTDITDREWKELRAAYFALITDLDRQLGSLLDQLEQAGQLDRTVVIVTSDHGRYLGAHRLDAHNFGAFEEAYNIPMVMAGPGIASNAESDALVSLADLCPTILELAGADPIDTQDSRSFAGVLRDPDSGHEAFPSCYAEYHGSRFTLTQRILWDGPWKFVFNGFDDDELYNLADDPHELRNLARDPANRDLVRRLMIQVWDRVRETGDRALLESHYSSMRFAAVGPNAAGR